MHKKSLNIVKNLGFGQGIVKDLEQLSELGSRREILTALKQLKLPLNATKQIKKIEDYSINVPVGANNEELLQSLAKKCKRSFEAFAKKQILAQVVFENNTWTLYGEDFDSNICKFHKVCKPYFDAWALKGLQATIIFNGTDKWKVKVKKP